MTRRRYARRTNCWKTSFRSRCVPHRSTTCCPPPSVAVGGAAHVEDHVTLEIESSRFDDNAAPWGGALSSYRALVEVRDSVFRGNRAGVDPSIVGVGGAVALTSSDGPGDPVNRRNAELVMTDSLIEGPGGPITVQQGGCLFANGDLNRMSGLNGVAPMGTAADNRARVELRDVESGEVDADADLDELAAFFTTALLGVAACIRAEAPPEQIHAAARVATSVLDASQTASSR